MLIGRLEARVEALQREAAELRPERGPAMEDLETFGNIVCLPGVTLASIRPDGGDDPGPSAA